MKNFRLNFVQQSFKSSFCVLGQRNIKAWQTGWGFPISLLACR